MRTVRLGFKPVPNPSWTCSHCLRQQKIRSQRASHATKSGRSRPWKSKKRTVILATAGGSLGTAALLTTASDDVKHRYAAAERTGRVASTLFACINE